MSSAFRGKNIFISGVAEDSYGTIDERRAKDIGKVSAISEAIGVDKASFKNIHRIDQVIFEVIWQTLAPALDRF